MTFVPITESETYRMSTEELWPRVEFLVEATHEETFQIWREWHKKLNLWSAGMGNVFTIDYVDIRVHGQLEFRKMPVAVCVSWHPVEGHLVGFYEATSLVVDHDMVRKWVQKQAPKAGHTNATNFHHVIHGLKLKIRGDA